MIPLTSQQDRQLEEVLQSKDTVYELIKKFRTIKESDIPPCGRGILTITETWLYEELCKIIDKERTHLVNMARVGAIP